MLFWLASGQKLNLYNTMLSRGNEEVPYPSINRYEIVRREYLKDSKFRTSEISLVNPTNCLSDENCRPAI